MITGKDLYDQFQLLAKESSPSLLPRFRDAVRAHGFDPGVMLPPNDTSGLNQIQAALLVLCDYNLANLVMSSNDQVSLGNLLNEVCQKWNQIHLGTRSRTQVIITDTLIAGNGWSPT